MTTSPDSAPAIAKVKARFRPWRSIFPLVLAVAAISRSARMAAQQSLSNVFAGMVLLLARPVDVGDPVLIRSGALGGELRGNVVEIGITYVRLGQ